LSEKHNEDVDDGGDGGDEMRWGHHVVDLI